jgi:DNA gyrase subunit A
MIAIQTSTRNGKVVGAVLVRPSDEIMLITTAGVLVRTRVSEIREMGRATQGVTLISVDDNSMLSGVRRVVESDADDDVVVVETGGNLLGDSNSDVVPDDTEIDTAVDAPEGDGPDEDSVDEDKE